MRCVFFLIFILILTACDSPDNSTEIENKPMSLTKKTDVAQDNTEVEAHSYPPLQPTVLIQEPTKVHVFETTAEALSVWRRAKDQRPTLLLLSNNPYLMPVPEVLRPQASRFIKNADLDSLRLATSDLSSSPTILPQMAIDVALRNGFFSELVWALPIRDTEKALSLEEFRDPLMSTRLISEDEGKAISLKDQIFSASFRGLPFRAAALPFIKGLQGPLIIHIDLGYFEPLYKNEISTPFLDIISETLQTLKKMQLETLAVTFSYGHLDNNISLDVRFLGDLIIYMTEDPEHLNRAVPINWQRQRDTLYLANFFQGEKIEELYKAQETEEPDAAYVKFNLYRSVLDKNERDKALEYLDQAVALDPMYALEYAELGRIAIEQTQHEEALRLIKLAAGVFDKDPFLKLQQAQLAMETGKKEEALELLQLIRNKEWSNIYYPHMNQYLSDLTTFVQTGEIPDRQRNDNKPVENNSGQTYPPQVDNSRQRVLHKK